MKSFYELSNAYVRVSGNVSCCFKINKSLSQEFFDVFMAVNFLHAWSDKKGVRHDAEETSQDVDTVHKGEMVLQY